MANLSDIYQLKEIDSPVVYKFLFASRGQRDVIKVIEYTYIQQFEDRELYNLGFGDNDPDRGQTTDLVQTNNGDAYKVFRTVLSSIPLFFERHPDAILMVQGSDGRPEFSDECRKTCQKNCATTCKKFNQRISLYRRYVEKNFSELVTSYWFLGGHLNSKNATTIELYIPGSKYDSIFLFKK